MTHAMAQERANAGFRVSGVTARIVSMPVCRLPLWLNTGDVLKRAARQSRSSSLCLSSHGSPTFGEGYRHRGETQIGRPLHQARDRRLWKRR